MARADSAGPEVHDEECYEVFRSDGIEIVLHVVSCPPSERHDPLEEDSSEAAPQTAETNRLEWRIFAASTFLTAPLRGGGG
jgi:hypothetical protein